AAMLAFLIVILLPPNDVPTPLGSLEVTSAPTIYDDLTNASSQPISRRIAYSEVGANGYLQAAYRSRAIDFYLIPLRYERTFVKFNEGNVDVTAQISLLGLPIYAGGTYVVILKSGKLDRICLGGHLGRLQIPGVLMNLIDGALGPLWRLVDRDRRIIQQMQ